MRKSQYYIVEKTKSSGKSNFTIQFLCSLIFIYPELERYSDKYRPSVTSQPTLKRKDLHAPFFPSEVFEDYFNPKRNKKGRVQLTVFLLLLFIKILVASLQSWPSSG
jgi:DNA-directed RNA polymerase III subunit RPC7